MTRIAGLLRNLTFDVTGISDRTADFWKLTHVHTNAALLSAFMYLFLPRYVSENAYVQNKIS